MTELPPISWRSETIWTKVLASLSICPRATCHKSVYDPTIRTYLHSDFAHKVSLKTDLPELHPKLSPGTSEADLLRHCERIPGVPAVRGFRETPAACVLSMNRIQGATLQDAMGNLTPGQATRIVAYLLQTVLAVSWRSVAHNDIVPRNIIVALDGRPYLVDFDQAHHSGRWHAFLRNVFGTRTDSRPVYGSWLLITARLVLQLLPSRRTGRMPALAADASPVQRKLHAAWKLAQRAGWKAGGEPVAHYSLAVDGLELPGERPWEPRWELLRNAADLARLRTLDLGCNMGLLSTWVLKEGNARSALGIDADPSVLASAKKVAEAFSVRATFEKVDLDAEYEWERRFEPADFDIVFVLDVFELIRDKRRLMDFLGRFPRVVFEGDERDAVAIRRFAAAGFRVHRALGISGRGRTVFVFSK